MKFKALFIILLFLSGYLSSISQTILSESFENAFPPTGWTIVNNGFGNTWILMPSGSGYALSGDKCMQYPSNISFAADTWIFSPNLVLTPGITYRLSYWYREATAGKTEKMKVTIGSNATIASQATILHDHPAITNTTYAQGIDNFTVPATGNYNFAFQCYSNPTSNSRLLIDSIVFEQVTATNCNGIPPTGTATAPYSVCSAATFTLHLDGVFTSTGFTYQWQSSPAGQNNFTDMPGATTRDYNTSITSTTDFRCKVTCSISGSTSTSNIITVNVPAICYCIPLSSNCNLQDVITNVNFAGINNNSSCSAAGYADYTISVNAGSFSAGSTVPISVTVGQGSAGGPNNIAAWIDFNKNGIFESSEFKLLGSGNGTTISNSIAVPMSATTGLTRMRIRTQFFTTISSTDACATFLMGETEDYFVNITPYICTGTPVAGTVTGPSVVCSGASFTLNLSGSYIGLNHQWQSSPAGQNNFTNISGATSQNLTTSQTVSKDYRCQVTCTANSLSTNSNTIPVTTSPFCYCSPNNFCNSSFIITKVVFGTINNITTCGTVGGYADYTATVPAATINAGSNIPIAVTISMAGFGVNSSVAVWIDYNQNGIFETYEFKSIGSGNGTTLNSSIFIPSNALPGPTRMRVRRFVDGNLTAYDACLVFTEGETEDYSLNIIAAPIAIYFTPFPDTLYDRIIPITCRIKQKDVGLNTSDSLKPTLWMTKPGAASWKSFKGTLLNGNANDGNWQFLVNHDSLNIRRNGCDSVVFYFVAQDLNTPFNLGYLPEAGTLHSNVNTMISIPVTPFGYRLKPRLKDTVYVSSGDCRYRSLSSERGLFQEIGIRKLEGDLTILIESDIIERGIYGLTSSGLNNHRVRIAPATNSVKTLNANFLFNNGAAIQLSGVKNVIVDGSFNGSGRYLKFRNTVSSVYTADTMSNIRIVNSCDSIVLQNLLFEHVSLLNDAGENSILLSWGLNKNIAILNNYFTGIIADQMPERFISSIGGNNQAIIIRGNEFNNFTQAGIKMFDPCTNWIIDSNHFYRTMVPAAYSYNCSGINIKGGGHIVKNNFIGGQAPFCAGNAMKFINNPGATITGIEAHENPGTTPNIISENNIYNIEATNTLASYADNFGGILCDNNNSIVRNNTIGNPQNTNPTIKILANRIYGIISYGNQPIDIRDNIVSGLTNNTGSATGGSLTGIHKGHNSGGFPAYNTPAIISGNRVYNIVNSSGSSGTPGEFGGTIGIYVSAGSYNLVEKNIVHDISCGSGKITGIGFIQGGGTAPSVIQRNRIYNLINHDNSVGSCCGDDAYNGTINGIGVSTENTGLDIINNQIALTNNNILNPVTIRGIFEGYGPETNPNPMQRIIYNSIYIGGTANNNGGSTAYLSMYQPVKEMYNNIFFNERTGGTKGHFAFRFVGNNAPTLLTHTRNNHNLYVVPDTSIFTEWMIFTGAPNIGWATWKARTNFDDTSYIVLPANIPSSQFFIDKAQGNLNINFDNVICLYANNKAKPYSFIPSDHDSINIRSVSSATGPTDIGSDEFTTNTTQPGSICSGTNTSFTSNLTGTSYQWQLKSGTSFVNISNNANYNGANANTLQITNVPFSWNGQEYRCMVNGNSYSNVFVLIVNETLSPAVIINTPTTTICSGSSVTFTAVPVNAGASPSFQWKKNGVNVGTNSNTYNTNTLVNGDIVSVVLTSAAPCVVNATATSNLINMTVNPSSIPSISINGNTVVTTGTATLLTATPTNGGSNPAYQWQDSTSASGWQNIAGATNSTLNYTPALTGHKIRCRITANATCATTNTAISNELTFTVNSVTGINPVPASVYGIRCYPNPVTSTLIIDNLNPSDKWQELEIISINGQQNLLSVNATQQVKLSIDVQRLTNGQYIAVLRNRSGVSVYLKFIKL